MNFLKQLEAASGFTRAVNKDRPWIAANLIKGNVAMSEKAKARYAAALQDWTTTTQLEMRLGMAATSANTTLRRYLDEGLILRRPRGGGKYNRKYGWEWKWNQK